MGELEKEVIKLRKENKMYKAMLQDRVTKEVVKQRSVTPLKGALKVLGLVESDVTEKTVKKAYREKAKLYHPDVCDEVYADGEKFKALNEAVKVVTEHYSFGDKYVFSMMTGSELKEAIKLLNSYVKDKELENGSK